MDPAVSRDTRLTFCTTGILLRRIAGDPELGHVSHVVVDEVHERSLQGDFLLAILRRLVARRAATPQPLKIVLMSATIDLELLSGYLGGCPTLSAKGRTFPVQQFYLEDVYEATAYHLPEDSPAALRLRRDQGLRRKVQKQGGVAIPACPVWLSRIQHRPGFDTVGQRRGLIVSLGNGICMCPRVSTT